MDVKRKKETKIKREIKMISLKQREKKLEIQRKNLIV